MEHDRIERVWTGFRQPVWELEPADPPPDQALALVGRISVPLGGLFVPKPVEEWVRGAEPRLLRVYDPIEKMEDLLDAVLGLEVDDDRELTEFVNAWGALGVGIIVGLPGDYTFDSVLATRETLRHVQELATRFDDLDTRFREGKSGTSKLPSVEEARHQAARIIPMPDPIRPRHHRMLQYLALAGEIIPRLRGVTPSVGWDEDAAHLVPLLQPRRLVDVLYIGLWQVLIREDVYLRACAYSACGRLFLARHGRAKYCRNAHARGAAQQAWRARRRHRQDKALSARRARRRRLRVAR
jgi:hypothetical protein